MFAVSPVAGIKCKGLENSFCKFHNCLKPMTYYSNYVLICSKIPTKEKIKCLTTNRSLLNNVSK